MRKNQVTWAHSDPLLHPGFIVVITFNVLFLLAYSWKVLRKKQWKQEEIAQGHAPHTFNEQSVIGSLMNNQESLLGSHHGSSVGRRSKGDKKHSTESSMIISKFGFRKQFGKPEMLGNTSNIYEALIDNEAVSDGENEKPKFQNFIPNITEFSAIMNTNDVSAINPEQYNHLRHVASKLGIATPLFLPKPTLGALNSSRSNN